MAIPTLTPASEVSAVALPRTGSASDVTLQTPIGVYDTSTDFYQALLIRSITHIKNLVEMS